MEKLTEQEKNRIRTLYKDEVYAKGKLLSETLSPSPKELTGLKRYGAGGFHHLASKLDEVETEESCNLTFEQLIEKFKSHLGGYTPWDLKEKDGVWQIESGTGCSSDFDLVGVKVNLSSGEYKNVMFDKVEDEDGTQYIRFEPVRTEHGPTPQSPFSLKQKK